MINPKSESFVFMKVGQHAGEDFESIIKRKTEEIKNTGMSFWGYGGPMCHPTKQIQPFAKSVIEKCQRRTKIDHCRRSIIDQVSSI